MSQSASLLWINQNDAIPPQYQQVLARDFQQIHTISSSKNTLNSLDLSLYQLVVLEFNDCQEIWQDLKQKISALKRNERPQILILVERSASDLASFLLEDGADDLLISPIKPQHLSYRLNNAQARKSINTQLFDTHQNQLRLGINLSQDLANRAWGIYLQCQDAISLIRNNQDLWFERILSFSETLSSESSAVRAWCFQQLLEPKKEEKYHETILDFQSEFEWLMDLVSLKSKNRPVTISIELEPHLKKVLGDRTHLRMIILLMTELIQDGSQEKHLLKLDVTQSFDISDSSYILTKIQGLKVNHLHEKVNATTLDDSLPLSHINTVRLNLAQELAASMNATLYTQNSKTLWSFILRLPKGSEDPSSTALT